MRTGALNDADESAASLESADTLSRADLLRGGAGADTLVGGAGNDFVGGGQGTLGVGKHHAALCVDFAQGVREAADHDVKDLASHVHHLEVLAWKRRMVAHFR